VNDNLVGTAGAFQFASVDLADFQEADNEAADRVLANTTLKLLMKHESQAIATCVGCGCDDYHACVDEASFQPCSWLRLDRESLRGVCSQCQQYVARWDNGDIQPTASSHK